MLTKSFSPNVSRIVLMVCLAMVSLRPFILPLTSTTITTSLGEVAAWIYLEKDSELSYCSYVNLITLNRLDVIYQLSSRQTERAEFKVYPFICSSVLPSTLLFISLLSSLDFQSSLTSMRFPLQQLRSATVQTHTVLRLDFRLLGYNVFCLSARQSSWNSSSRKG